jgi:hypothetical protein
MGEGFELHTKRYLSIHKCEMMDGLHGAFRQRNAQTYWLFNASNAVFLF